MDENLYKIVSIFVPIVVAIISPLMSASLKVREVEEKNQRDNASRNDPAPAVDKRKVWTDAMFSMQSLSMAVLGATIAAAVIFLMQYWLMVRIPRIDVNVLDKPFQSISQLEAPVPVFNESKIAGTTRGVSPGHSVWVFLCDARTDECNSFRLPIFQSGEWEDSIRIGDDSQTCMSFSAQFVLLDDAGDHMMRVRPSQHIQKRDLPVDHYLDKDVFVIRLVSDDQSCVTASTVNAIGGKS
jgi:hypothetical protein